MERYPDFNLDAYDRFIPHQDVLDKGGFGNLIALPLQGRAVKNQRSVFVDEDLRAFPDQMEYLSRARKLTAFELDGDISRLAKTPELGNLVPNEAEEELGKPWERKKVETPLLQADFSGSVVITYAKFFGKSPKDRA
jgi:hypothetical protein